MNLIKKHLIKQINTVFIPSNASAFDAGYEQLKTRLVDIYGESKVVLTQIPPDIIILFDTTNSIYINVLKKENRIVVADGKVNPYKTSPQDLEKFVKVVDDVRKIIGKTNNYGFNVVSEIELSPEVKENSGKFIAKNILDKTLHTRIKNIESAAISLVYEEDNARMQIKLEPRLTEKFENTKSLIVSSNRHNEGQIQSLTALMDSYTKFYDQVEEKLLKVLGRKNGQS